MKTAIVLLSDHNVQNYARHIVFDLNHRWGVPFYASLLPSHVSLKQPFTFESMDALERYFDGLAARTTPFDIDLDGLYYGEWTGYGILGLTVVETPALRALHNRLNAELPGVVRDASAAHDGEEYSFHLTIEMGKVESDVNPFRECYESADRNVKMRFTARHLAMFYYPDDAGAGRSFIAYRVQPLGG